MVLVRPPPISGQFQNRWKLWFDGDEDNIFSWFISKLKFLETNDILLADFIKYLITFKDKWAILKEK